MRRYEIRSTIMTSNRPLEDWAKLIGDVPSASAILDRFLHHAEILSITGRSYRLRNRLDASEPGPTDLQEDSKPAISPPGSNGPKPNKQGAKTPAPSDATTCQS